MDTPIGVPVLLEAVPNGRFLAGSGVWTSNDESVATVEQDATDELFSAVNPLAEGTAVIDFSVVPNPDDPTATPITGTISITVTAAAEPNATSVEIRVRPS